MKFSEWKEVINTKGMHFLVRDDIENIIKELNIDRSRFHEYPKTGYKEIIKKFYFTFCDIKNFPVHEKIDLSVNRMHFRSDLKEEGIDCFFRTNDWCEYMDTIKKDIQDSSQKLFVILGEGWVYEGYRDELFEILKGLTYINDFYIISSKFQWFIAVSYIEDNATIYFK